MSYGVRITISLVAILLSCISVSRAAASYVDPCYRVPAERQIATRMFELAHAHDVKALLATWTSISRTNDQQLMDAYPLALYLADPRRFARRFVDEFHPDERGWNAAVFLSCLQFANGHHSDIVPDALVPYNALDKIALNGDKVAIKKALMALTDGYIAEVTDENNAYIVTRYPHTSLNAIGTMTEPQRSRVICYNIDAWSDKEEYDRFLSRKPVSGAEASLLADLNRLHKGCTTTAKTQ
jgi:hypothetical protein